MNGHPLAAVLRDAGSGCFPAPDGGIDFMPPVDGLAAAMVAFTGHTFLAADVEEAEVLAHLPATGLGAAMHPAFIAWLGDRIGAQLYTPDLVLAASRAEPPGEEELVERADLLAHPRALLAQRYRRDVLAYSNADGDGLLTLGRGLCGRLEVSIEVEPAQRSRGLGRSLAYAARTLAPKDEPVFASVSPGNAASLRAFLAAGYVPIGSEVLLLRRATRNA